MDPLLLNTNEELAIKDLLSRFFDDLISYLHQAYTPKFIKNRADEPFHNWYSPSLSNQKDTKIIIFTHNLGKFDVIFLIKGLLKIVHYHNVKTIINKENEFIEINAKIDKFKFIWKDSLRIFNVSLKELCDIFNSNTKKLHSYKSEYNNMKLFNDPVLLEEFKQYSAQDSISLLESLKIAQDLYSHLYQVDITSIWSASTLAMKIFRLKYLKKSIPTLNKYLDYFIRESYYGGITDVYKLYGENIFYYDVNSLYPHAMLNAMPSKMIHYYDSMKEINLSEFFGFCSAIIKAPKNIKMPLLPFRLKNGNVIYPTGQWIGTYFSEELKTVMNYGYKVIPLQGYSFEKEDYFSDYVNYFYNLKKMSNGPLRYIIKGLLNNLYGYFGRSLDLITSVNVGTNEMKEYLTYQIIHNMIPVDEKTGIYLLLVSDELKQNTFKQLNLKLINTGFSYEDDTSSILSRDNTISSSNNQDLFYNKSTFSTQQNPFKIKGFHSVMDMTGYSPLNPLNERYNGIKANVAIASAVTSYARISMINLKMKLIQMGYTLYYSDTDSLFIDRPLPNSFLNDELGGFKDELKGMTISKAYFLGSKKYGYQIKLDDGSMSDHSVFAGITRHSLKFNEIERLAKGEIVYKTKLIQFNRDIEQLKIQIKENLPVQLKKSSNKELIDNNYINPHIHHYKLKQTFFVNQKLIIQKIINRIKHFLLI